mgnify:CR=1 FL=1
MQEDVGQEHEHVLRYVFAFSFLAARGIRGAGGGLASANNFSIWPKICK